jgi:hypothetical protein
METFFSGLLVAALTGLTYVAYKHPKGYVRIQLALLVIGVIGFSVLGIWEFGTLRPCTHILHYRRYLTLKNVKRRAEYNRKIRYLIPTSL